MRTKSSTRIMMTITMKFVPLTPITPFRPGGIRLYYPYSILWLGEPPGGGGLGSSL
jgi:hypothetical protein